MRRAIALIAFCCALPFGAFAADEAAALLERAEFWQSRNRDDLAQEALDRLFRLSPDDPNGLLVQAKLQLKVNQDREATATYERLRRAHPDHAATKLLATLLRLRAGPDRDRVRQARGLAKAGRFEEAAKVYRGMFPETFPDDELALEYAQWLGATPKGWEPAQKMIADLVAKHPEDPKYRVALASHLSWRQPVSAETLKTLRELAAIPSVARQAKEAWRRALIQMDEVPANLPPIREYVALDPADTTVKEKLDRIEQGRGIRRDVVPAKRVFWTMIEEGRLDAADASLASALAKNARDSEALGALGILRLKQDRHAESVEALEKAAKLDRAGRKKWEDLARTARYWGLIREAAKAREAGNLALAQSKVTEARGLDSREVNGALEAARVSALAGRASDAEKLYREALTLDPGNTRALEGLIGALLAAGRRDDADEVAKGLTDAQRREIGGTVDAMRAGNLQEEAKRLEAQGRARDATGALERAAALAPDDPWVRLDLARRYAAGGDPPRGRALFDELIQRRPGDPDARYAAALYLSSLERNADAMALLEGVPEARRTANMTSLQRRLWVAAQADRAAAFAQGGEKSKAAEVLASMRAVAGDDPELALDVAGAYVKLGDMGGAKDLLARAPARQTLAWRIAEARLYDRMGADAELVAALERIASLGPTTSEQDEAIADMRLGIALRKAASLRAAGHREEALAVLRQAQPARATPAQAARRDAAVMETLLEQGDAAAAKPLVDAALTANPEDENALMGAAQIALAEGRVDDAIDYRRRALAAQAARLEPDYRWRQLAELIDRRTTWATPALEWLQRSGAAGKSRISAQEMPLAVSGWSDAGRWFARATPVRVSSGALDLADATEASTFGSVLLCQPLCSSGLVSHIERGVAIAAGIERGGFRADAGTTPLGFPVVNAVGGLAYKGDLGPASFTLELARRALPSSLLSYAGARDPNTGRTWGGVVSNGVRLNLSRDSGGDFGAWSVLGRYRLTGRNVQDNDKTEAMAGVYGRVVNESDRLFTVGLTGMLWLFSENAGEYTLGHGGYYSPKSFRSVSLPVTFAHRTERFSFSLRASGSVSWSESRLAPYYPVDPDLQARAEALAPVNFTDPFYSGGNNGRSFGRSFAAAGEYQVAPGLFLGARAEVDRSTNYTPNRFLIYLRIPLERASARPVAMPPEPEIPGAAY